MKALLRAILPRSVKIRLRMALDAAEFTMTPKLGFDAAALRTRGGTDLAKVLADSDAAASFARDHQEIAATFGDDDRFGGVNPGDRRALYQLLRVLRPKRVLEVGTHIGASTLYIARALKANGSGTVTTVDIFDVNHPETGAWRSVGQRMSPREFMKTMGVGDLVTFKVSDSHAFLANDTEKYDLIFLDGDHSAKAVYREVSASLTRLAPGGLILLHDYYPGARSMYPDGAIIAGPYYAMSRIAREAPAVGVLPLGELPWPTKQGTRMTSLALVVRD